MAVNEKSASAFRTISEAADAIGVAQHVLRFWETRFPQLQPLKRGGNRRYYRPSDMALLEMIRSMLHDQGLTIRGAQLALAAKPGKAAAEPAPVLPLVDEPLAVQEAPTAPPAPLFEAAPALVTNVVPAAHLDKIRTIRDRLRLALAA